MVANADASYINPSVPPPEYMYEPVVVVIGVPAKGRGSMLRLSSLLGDTEAGAYGMYDILCANTILLTESKVLRKVQTFSMREQGR